MNTIPYAELLQEAGFSYEEAMSDRERLINLSHLSQEVGCLITLQNVAEELRKGKSVDTILDDIEAEIEVILESNPEIFPL